MQQQAEPQQIDYRLPEVIQEPQTFDTDSLIIKFDTINIETDIESEFNDEVDRSLELDETMIKSFNGDAKNRESHVTTQ